MAAGGSRHGTGSSPGHPAAGGGHATLVRRTQSSLVSLPVTGVVVRGSVGTVSITGGDRSTVAITAHLVYRGSAPVLTRRVSGGVLDLGYRCPSRSRNCGVSFDLTVPRGLSTTVQLAVGPIRLSGLSGTITAHTQVGSVRLSVPRAAASSHVIEATTGTGTVTVAGS
jgi:hypothetical protein